MNLTWTTSELKTNKGPVRITHSTRFAVNHVLEALMQATPVSGHISKSKLNNKPVIIRTAPGSIALSAAIAFKHLKKAVSTGILEFPVALVEEENKAHVITLERPFTKPFEKGSEQEKINAATKAMKGIARLHAIGIDYGKPETNIHLTPTGRVVLTDFIGLQESINSENEAEILADYLTKKINSKTREIKTQLINTYFEERKRIAKRPTR